MQEQNDQSIEGDWAAKLIRLKRYETPGADYFERFLEDFHERQRSEPLQVSVTTLAMDRLSTWWRGVSATAKLASVSALFVGAFGIMGLTWTLRFGSQSSEHRPGAGPSLAEVSLVREF